jgi:hypothetical protein
MNWELVNAALPTGIGVSLAVVLAVYLKVKAAWKSKSEIATLPAELLHLLLLGAVFALGSHAIGQSWKQVAINVGLGILTATGWNTKQTISELLRSMLLPLLAKPAPPPPHTEEVGDELPAIEVDLEDKP